MDQAVVNKKKPIGDALGFVDKLLLNQGYIVFFHEGLLEDLQPYYLYLAVHGTKLPSYYALLQQESSPSLTEFEKLGFIAACGKGTPDKKTKQQLKEEFGIITS